MCLYLEPLSNCTPALIGNEVLATDDPCFTCQCKVKQQHFGVIPHRYGIKYLQLGYFSNYRVSLWGDAVFG